MDLTEAIRTALLPLLDEKLQPLQSEVQNQSLAISRLTEEIANLHGILVRGPSPLFDANRSFDVAPVRKSLPGGQRMSFMVESSPKLHSEEVKTHRKSESTVKSVESKTLAQKREEEKASKLRKEQEAKKAEEEAKKKREESKTKARVSTANKQEEEKKRKLAPKKPMGEKKVAEELHPAEETERLEAVIEPAVLASIESEPIHPALLEPGLQSLPGYCSDPKFAETDKELKRLADTYGEQALLTMAPFQLSLGTKSALSLLNTMEDSQLYVNSLPTREEVYWVFRLFFQLCGETLADNKEAAWSVCRDFLATGKATGLEEKVTEVAAGFCFSNENIDQVEVLLGEKTDRINPSLYNTFCTLSGLMMFPIKEALVYAGLLPDKVQPWRKFQRLLYKRKSLV